MHQIPTSTCHDLESIEERSCESSGHAEPLALPHAARRLVTSTGSSIATGDELLLDQQPAGTTKGLKATTSAIRRQQLALRVALVHDDQSYGLAKGAR